MTIDHAKSLLKHIYDEQESKNTKNTIWRLVGLLQVLQERGLCENEMMKLEENLDSLDIEVGRSYSSRAMATKLLRVIHFVRKEYGLVEEGYYVKRGTFLGMMIGVLLGTSVLQLERSLGIALGVGVGTALGNVIGSYKDKKVKREGKVLNF
ncbi:hypothetical protein K4L44_08070 [Halosquirtibacter laminarini]|uniref:Uncharacterized protein n=1 Tax=Halosquirtibacter laminarini TaxID=3374600 RepID=A0AC61NJ59_9BACT|nr:hypothetical protein K4L44_08070 [Prolixibacteraceae bacterium]